MSNHFVTQNFEMPWIRHCLLENLVLGTCKIYIEIYIDFYS